MNVIPLPQPVAIAPHRIHPHTRPGYVHLKVANLENQLVFYQQVLGLRLHWQDGNSAGLGTGSGDIVRLTQIPNGKRYRGVTGIYHFAILFPDRRQLARAISHLFTLRWTNYPTDHIMTKTTYLDDPEGNNIELYCESPEDGVNEITNGQFHVRRADGSISDGREALDLDSLFSHLSEDGRLDEPVPPEVRMGHFHLYVANLNETRRFYHDLLGFDDMGMARNFRMGMVSAGGYHHHIGYNTWQGEGAPPPPEDALGLKNISFVLPDRAARDQLLVRIVAIELPYQQTDEGILVTDPAQNGVLFTRNG
ncbi:MAG TPA: VOC family protein [Anaerolineaceae bacterium]|nr:VOC family protein [Anaerolineaceae bacterium]